MLVSVQISLSLPPPPPPPRVLSCFSLSALTLSHQSPRLTATPHIFQSIETKLINQFKPAHATTNLHHKFYSPPTHPPPATPSGSSLSSSSIKKRERGKKKKEDKRKERRFIPCHAQAGEPKTARLVQHTENSADNKRGILLFVSFARSLGQPGSGNPCSRPPGAVFFPPPLPLFSCPEDTEASLVRQQGGRGRGGPLGSLTKRAVCFGRTRSGRRGPR